MNLMGNSRTENGAARSAASLVADALRSDILHNRLRGGERLRQDAIAGQHGVSQMIVREAFKQLTSEGFLRAEPRRGVSVAILSADEAWEITQLRALLECQALSWSIPNMLRSDFVECTKILDELDASSSVDSKISLNALFHSHLYAPAQREKTLDMINTLRLNFERYLRFTWEETHHIDQSQIEHRNILNFCQMRDAEKACGELRKHILATGDLLVDSLGGSNRR